MAEKQISIILDSDLLKALDIFADQRRENRTVVVRALIREALERAALWPPKKK